MFYKILFSPQVKRWMPLLLINIDIYGLLHELLNDLTLRILGNQNKGGKGLNSIGMIP